MSAGECGVHCRVCFSEVSEEVVREVDADELEAGVYPDDAAAGAVRSVAAVGDGVAHVCFFAGVYGVSEACLVFGHVGEHEDAFPCRRMMAGIVIG
jgi:hypothetical protein